eukprot:TRINITY_DN3925_c0_g1_i2.p1 TRINITY_DN3925_c0_g1~~TRINITY_DN3925_c0_g1_i2.p1  ORF type:complete len:288 (+),score=47.72 TRINITY_DN3925_c0_g1_i2:115-978(+)
MFSPAIVVVAVLTSLVKAQPTELICYNPPLVDDPFAFRRDPAEILPLVSLAQEIVSEQLEGLSVEEAAAILPETMSSLAPALINEAIMDAGGVPTDINPADVSLAAFQAVITDEDTAEAFDKMLEDPANFARAFQLIISSFNTSCMDDPFLAFTIMFVQLTGDLLQEPFIDNALDVINTTAVIALTEADLVNGTIRVLEPLVEALETSESSEGVFGALLSFATDDVITTALASALESVDVEVLADKDTMAALLTNYFNRLQQGFGVDQDDFFDFIAKLLNNILDALK